MAVISYCNVLARLCWPSSGNTHARTRRHIMHISPGKKEYKQIKTVECIKCRRWLEIADEAVPNLNDIETQILVEIEFTMLL